MASTTSMKRGVAFIRREWRKGRYDHALAKVERLLKEWPDNPQLLTMRGNLIQLQEKDVGPTLDNARRALERAVDLDEESPRALIELGHFLNAGEDDTDAVAKCFAKAVRLSKGLDVDEGIALRAGQIAADLSDRGIASKTPDMLLAAHSFGSRTDAG